MNRLEQLKQKVNKLEKKIADLERQLKEQPIKIDIKGLEINSLVELKKLKLSGLQKQSFG